MDASYISVTGLKAAEDAMTVASDNLANIKTKGYKTREVGFSSLMNGGVAADQSRVLFDSGEMSKTGDAYDVSVSGNGFIELTDGRGNTYLSKGGRVELDSAGYMKLHGLYLAAPVSIGSSDAAFSINTAGEVYVDTNGKAMLAGKIDLVRVNNLDQLAEVRSGIYGPSGGVAIETEALRDDAKVSLLQGTAEESNVDMTKELLDIMAAQKMYQSNSKMIGVQTQVDQWLNELLDV